MSDARGTPYAFELPIQPLAGVLMNLLARLHPLLAGLGAAAVFATAPALAQTRWDLPAAYPANNFHTENLQQFANDVDKATGGKLKITVHANASLFKANEIKRAVQGGQAQIGEILLTAYSNEWPIYGIDGLPFLADSYASAKKLDTASKPAMEKKLAEQGIMLLYTVPWPPQGIYVNKAISSAADLKGVKWRAYSTATARIAELVGAQPVTVQAAELSQAMATGVIESYMSSGSTGYDTKTPTSTSSTGTTPRRGCRRTRCSSTRLPSTTSTSRRRRRCSRPAPTPRRAAGRSRRRRTASTSTC